MSPSFSLECSFYSCQLCPFYSPICSLKRGNKSCHHISRILLEILLYFLFEHISFINPDDAMSLYSHWPHFSPSCCKVKDCKPLKSILYILSSQSVGLILIIRCTYYIHCMFQKSRNKCTISSFQESNFFGLSLFPGNWTIMV